MRLVLMQEVDIEEQEEIKEVRGLRYSKMSQLFNDIITEQHILEPNTGAIGYRPLRSNLIGVR